MFYEGNTPKGVVIFVAVLASIILLSSHSVSQELASDDHAVEKICGHIGFQSPIIHEISIKKNTNSALFLMNWTKNESGLKLILIPPDNKETLDINCIQHEIGSVHEFYLLRNPASGVWKAEIEGNNLSLNEDDYCLVVELLENDTVQGDKVSFNGIFSEDAKDRDHNGIYDLIKIKVGLNVFAPGEYIVKGSLQDQSGRDESAISSDYLGVGAQALFLEFPGWNAKGKRYLHNLTLYDEEGELLGSMDMAYTTDEYSNMQEKSTHATLRGDYTDQGIDVNGDGLYDFLSIDAGVDVQSPGEYSLTGTLYDQKDDEVVWSIAHKNLSSGYQKMILDFDGKTIWKHGIDGPYVLKNLLLSGRNWSQNDLVSDAYTTSKYNASQFVDPVYPEKIVAGSGLGELLITIAIKESLPVFDGRFSQDIVGINIPPLSSPWQVNGSRFGYAYEIFGIYMPNKPNNFTVIAEGVKNLNIGLKKDQEREGTNISRTWVTSQIDAMPDGRAVAETDLISPGSYHVKIFGDAIDNATEVNLLLTVAKKIKVDGKFNLSINTTGFPPGNYSMTAKAINGTFEFDELNLGNLL